MALSAGLADADALAVLGDAVTCAGFRLAGVSSHVADPQDAGAQLRVLRHKARMIMITEALAQAVPEEDWQMLRAEGGPLIAVIPSVTQPTAGQELVQRIRLVLGVET